MKWQVTIKDPDKPEPFTFEVTLEPADMLKLEKFLKNYSVSYRAVPYEPEQDAPWPIGPTLEDM